MLVIVLSGHPQYVFLCVQPPFDIQDLGKQDVGKKGQRRSTHSSSHRTSVGRGNPPSAAREGEVGSRDLFVYSAAISGPFASEHLTSNIIVKQ